MESKLMFIKLFIVGVFVIALAMEFIKLSGKKKAWVWKLIAVLLSIGVDASIFFGIENDYKIAILPLMIFATYVLQYGINQFGAKKLVLSVVNQYLVKHGYKKIEE